MNQFNNKTKNDISERRKSELIKFYLKRKNNISLLSYDEIKVLNNKYNEIVNKSFCDNHYGIPEIIDYLNDLDDDIIIVE